MDTLISKLKNDKIKINWNKFPIKMELFKSFVTVELTKTSDHLGASTGWTQYINKEHDLIIGGGIVGAVDYLDRIQYKNKLQNPYNSFCNPFYLKEIITKEGIEFFKEYYKSEIYMELYNVEMDIDRAKKAVVAHTEKLEKFKQEVENL